jgi:hypothetical protein
MKRNIVWTMVFFAALLLSMPAVAKDNRERDRDRGDCTCSLAMVAGEWGYLETGTVYLPTGPLAYASLGRYTLDADGNLLGARTAFIGNSINPMNAWIKGTITVNSDCTGTETLNFYSDPDYKNLTGTGAKNVVYVNKAREARKILIPNAVPGFPAVLTTEAKKLLPDSDNRNWEGD